MSDSHSSIVELIELKRDGGTLSDANIRRLISAYTSGDMPDYQMSALLMAIYLKGMTDPELAVWTRAMLESGDRIDLSGLALPKVDKHSTGGVGDKVSIALAPLVAECGVAVPMMSGRGLGHTGGTLDKLESIEGFNPQVDPVTFVAMVQEHNFVMAGQTAQLVPADRKLYALRDATGTVSSIPLIASSIMSKKLAEDLDALVLDVKTGVGAFMQEEAQARRLAETMVEIGAAHGVETRALITAMDQPLGNAVGNANEVAESIATLQGEGPDDLTELVLRLGAQMLVAGTVAESDEAATRRLEAALSDGSALKRFRRLVAAQGGDPSQVDDPSLLPTAEHSHVITAPAAGIVEWCDARMIGAGAMRLGAGRATTEDDIDPAVGINLAAKQGAKVASGDVLATVTYNDPARLESAMEMFDEAWQIGPGPAPDRPLVLDRVGP